MSAFFLTSAVYTDTSNFKQHGSVYWSHEANALLGSLEPEKTLSEQLVPKAFSIDQSPIWQDSSTTKECLELNDIAGGEQALADLTGSRAYERFTGTQIAKASTYTNAMPAGFDLHQ